MDLTEQPLNRLIHKIALGFVAVFAVSCVAIAIYQVVWVMPEKRCLDANGWWDPGQRVCGTPIFLPDLTHRPIGAPKLTPLSR